MAKDWLHLDKKWITDLLLTIDTKGIQEMIDRAMTVRKQKIEPKQDSLVDVRPEFAAALNTTLSFSSKLHFQLTHCRAERYDCEPNEAGDQEEEDQEGDGEVQAG